MYILYVVHWKQEIEQRKKKIKADTDVCIEGRQFKKKKEIVERRKQKNKSKYSAY